MKNPSPIYGVALTLIDIIKTIEDCLPLNESNSQATGN